MGQDGALSLDTPGRFQVSAEFQGRIVSTMITVTAAKLKSLSISPATPQVPKGLSQAFTATAKFSDGTTQDVTEGATWSDKDLVGSGVVSLTSEGVATAKNVGRASITAHYKTLTASTTLTVTAPSLTALTLSPTNPSIAVGSSVTFSAHGAFSDGTVQDVTAAATWGSADLSGSGVASMDGATATGDSAGQATISVFYEGLEADTTLTVNAITLTALSISPLNPSVAIGGTQQFTATGSYSDGTTQILTTKVSWTATDIAPAVGVASITSGGLATGNQGGQSTITASYLGLSTSTTTTVKQPGFGTGTTFGTGSSPYSVAVGDFNGDGHLDIVTANSGSNNVSVLLGNGSGNFSTATNFDAGGRPNWVAVGKFSGSADDLALAIFPPIGNGSTNVLLGDARGNFGPPISYPYTATNDLPVAVAVGDFNKDGKLDIVTADITASDNDSVSLLLGDGTGNFGPPTNFSASFGLQSMAVGDFNNDGKLDIATFGSGDIGVLLGDGAGNFSAPINFKTGGMDSQRVAVGDFNDDANIDLVTTEGSDQDIHVLLGDGTGSFGAPTSFAFSGFPSAIVVADLNGDGFNDLAIGGLTSGDVGVMLGDGAGNFAAPNLFPAHGQIEGIATGDFNGDGKPDLVTANANTNNITVFLNQ
jgi:hypothetical protein